MLLGVYFSRRFIENQRVNYKEILALVIRGMIILVNLYTGIRAPRREMKLNVAACFSDFVLALLAYNHTSNESSPAAV